VQEAGSRPEVMQRLMARSSGLRGFLTGRARARAFDGVVLVVGLLDVGVVLILLALLEGFGAGDLIGGGLLAGGKELPDGGAVMLVYCMIPLAMTLVGMADHAGAGVGLVADVAVLDDEALAVADVGDVGERVVLLREESRREEGQHKTDGELEEGDLWIA